MEAAHSPLVRRISGVSFGAMVASLLFLPIATLGFDGEESFRLVQFFIVAVREDLLDETPANLFALVFLVALGSGFRGIWLSVFGTKRARLTPALVAGIGAASLLVVPFLGLVTGATLDDLAHVFLVGYWVAFGSALLAFSLNLFARSRPAA